MKKVLAVLSLTGVLLAGFSAGADEMAPGVDAFMSPLVGVHKLVGDAGCERIQIEPFREYLGKVDYYRIDAGSNRSVSVFYGTRVKLKGRVLKYSMVEGGGMFGGGDHQRNRATIIKDKNGRLERVTLERDRSMGWFGSWRTEYKVSCIDSTVPLRRGD